MRTRWTMMARRWARSAAITAITALALPILGGGGLAQGPAQTPIPPDVDFWQPRWMHRELWGPGRLSDGLRVRILRHSTYVQFGVPSAYAGARSPLDHSAPVLAEGARLYENKCASCHGKNGLGDGDAANALTPSPALLGYMIQRPISVDEYLLWAISDGGKPFDSAMPAFADQLTRDEIWKIIAYMRSGFGQAERGAPAK